MTRLDQAAVIGEYADERALSVGAGRRCVRAVHAGLKERLEHPAIPLTFSGLPELWQRTIIRIRCHRPNGQEEGPWLPGFIRGALGRALIEWAERRGGDRADPFDRPSAYDVLFTTQGRQSRFLDLPKPFVIAVATEARAVVITVTLFGFAAYWSTEVRAALERALAGAIALSPSSWNRAPMTPIDADCERVEGVPVAASGCRATLRFHTPLCLKRGQALMGSVDSILVSLADRIAGLARWHDVAINCDWGMLRRAAATLSYDSVRLRPVAWPRHSIQQGTTPIAMAGLIGTLAIEGKLDPFLPLLAIGATCHVGGQASQGLGRFDLAIEP